MKTKHQANQSKQHIIKRISSSSKAEAFHEHKNDKGEIVCSRHLAKASSPGHAYANHS